MKKKLGIKLGINPLKMFKNKEVNCLKIINLRKKIFIRSITL